MNVHSTLYIEYTFIFPKVGGIISPKKSFCYVPPARLWMKQEEGEKGNLSYQGKVLRNVVDSFATAQLA